jgi:hypothetical protein
VAETESAAAPVAKPAVKKESGFGKFFRHLFGTELRTSRFDWCFVVKNGRGPGGPRYSRPGGQRYILQEILFIKSERLDPWRGEDCVERMRRKCAKKQ